MNQYSILLFDCDNTLLDFDKAEAYALKTVFAHHCYPFNEEINRKYQEINSGLWAKHEKNLIDESVISATRFQILFDTIGIQGNGKAFNDEYLNALGDGSFLIDGALNLCRTLSKKYRLYLVTNGFSKPQHRRFKSSGLSPYFSDIFVSEEVGHQKPMKKFYSYVFSKIPDFRQEKALMIGDSLTSDMRGGSNSGIDTCWYNPKRLKNTIGVPVNYEISDLNDLIDLIETHI